MAKEKLTLTELKVESCVTSLTGEQLGSVKGGLAIVQGRRHNYTIRWTAVDTRVQSDAATAQVSNRMGKGTF